MIRSSIVPYHKINPAFKRLSIIKRFSGSKILNKQLEIFKNLKALNIFAIIGDVCAKSTTRRRENKKKPSCRGRGSNP